jgi:hypothetical protein
MWTHADLDSARAGDTLIGVHQIPSLIQGWEGDMGLGRWANIGPALLCGVSIGTDCLTLPPQVRCRLRGG